MATQRIWTTSPTDEAAISASREQMKAAGEQVVQHINSIGRNTGDMQEAQQATLNELRDFQADVNTRLNEIEGQIRQGQSRLDTAFELLGKIYVGVREKLIPGTWQASGFATLCIAILILGGIVYYFSY
jgi:uncharacterized protein (DUF885 family)